MGDARQPLIQIEEMTKVFYTDEIETHALSGVHLSIAKGEYVAMSGPSGCGKSTLLSIIGLLDTPTNGRYLLNDKRAGTGIVFVDRPPRLLDADAVVSMNDFAIIDRLWPAEKFTWRPDRTART